MYGENRPDPQAHGSPRAGDTGASTIRLETLINFSSPPMTTSGQSADSRQPAKAKKTPGSKSFACSSARYPAALAVGTPQELYIDRIKGGRSLPYAPLLFEAFMKAPNHEMTLSGIYDWFNKYTNKPFEARAKGASQEGWKNSIRHNLSMNLDFIKVPISCGSSKGRGKRQHIWRLSEDAQRRGSVLATTRYRSPKRPANESKIKCQLSQPLAAGAKFVRVRDRQAFSTPEDDQRLSRHSGPESDGSPCPQLTSAHSHPMEAQAKVPLRMQLPLGSNASVDDGTSTPVSAISLVDSASGELSTCRHSYSPDAKSEETYDADRQWIETVSYDHMVSDMPFKLGVENLFTGTNFDRLQPVFKPSRFSVGEIFPWSEMAPAAAASNEPATCSMAELRLRAIQEDHKLFAPSCESSVPSSGFPYQHQNLDGACVAASVFQCVPTPI